MLIFYSLIFGLIQGLTEFLPISSSGHLVILHQLINFNLKDPLAFDVALHLGTFISLLIFFWSDVLKYLKAFFSSFIKWDLKNSVDQRLAWMILVASLPVFVIGYLIATFFPSFFRSLSSVAIMLIFFGILFFIYEKASKKEDNFEQLSWSSALKIGLAQILSLIPGVSRSGITIIAGLGENLKREQAARFSFLLSLPAIFGAGVKKMYDLSQVGLESGEGLIFLFGFLSSMIIGYFCIKYFLRYLEKHSLNPFGIYRLILGGLILAIIYLI